MSFAQLKKNSKTSLDAIKTKIANTENKFQADTRFYYPERDKAGNGEAVFRFLPTSFADGDDALPYVKYYHHSFKGPGGWYIENSLTTMKLKDPVTELNNAAWNLDTEAGKALARSRKRQCTYVSNILVIEDEKHPENVGKIFLFKYGKKIYDKIMETMNDDKINVFDFWGGANFKLKIKKVADQTNYDSSKFLAPAALSKDDSELEKYWKNSYSLSDLIAPDKFKTYAELKTRLDIVTGKDASTPVTAQSSPPLKMMEDDSPVDDIPFDVPKTGSIMNYEDLLEE